MDWLSIKEHILDISKYSIIILCIIFFIMYIASITQVVGNSMSPTLEEGQVVILNKFQYRFFEVQREDIISLSYQDTKYLIKRVIGLPGEKIDIVDNNLYINDKIYNEKYIEDDINYSNFHLKDLGYDTIPKDMYLVLGDNRKNSLDSRKIGLIKKEDIKGKIFFRFWPINKLKFF